MQLAAGPYAAALLSLTICATALSTINGTIITGARVYYALGRDVPRLHALAGWSARKETPVAALLAQGAITLVLVALGAFSQNSRRCGACGSWIPSGRGRSACRSIPCPRCCWA
ncbi:hypothetical protein G6F58_013166 [Rhizopus delemar]|nr:hypothetical protein G6F58_013166 [Rhizopus delemar]